jgi:hypothetical protein
VTDYVSIVRRFAAKLALQCHSFSYFSCLLQPQICSDRSKTEHFILTDAQSPAKCAVPTGAGRFSKISPLGTRRPLPRKFPTQLSTARDFSPLGFRRRIASPRPQSHARTARTQPLCFRSVFMRLSSNVVFQGRGSCAFGGNSHKLPPSGAENNPYSTGSMVRRQRDRTYTRFHLRVNLHGCRAFLPGFSQTKH